MNQSITKSCLSPAQTHLVELLQRLNFGRVEALRVSAGKPVFDPPPRVIQTVKLGSDNGPRPELTCGDFRLKHQIIEMLEIISGLGEGEVRAMDVRYGLPYCMEIERTCDFGCDNSVRGTAGGYKSVPGADVLPDGPSKTIYLELPGPLSPEEDGGIQ